MKLYDLVLKSYDFLSWGARLFYVFVVCISTGFFCYSSRIIISNIEEKNEKYESAGTVLEYNLSFFYVPNSGM